MVAYATITIFEQLENMPGAQQPQSHTLWAFLVGFKRDSTWRFQCICVDVAQPNTAVCNGSTNNAVRIRLTT